MNDAALVAALFAVDPVGTGGVALRAAHGPARDAWLAGLRNLLPTDTPWRRLPLHIHDERLLGGLDLGATLQAGRPVARRGVLAEADGGVLSLAMAERLPAGAAARIAAAIDAGEVQVERDGVGLRLDARFGVVALDEGIGDDERPAPALLDRLGFHLALDEAPLLERRDDEPGGRGGAAPTRRSDADGHTAGGAAFDRRGAAVPAWTADGIQTARRCLPDVGASGDIVQALCAAALALGVASLRAPLLALRVARAAAALDGRLAVETDDAALAARLVLAPRATRLPAADASPASTTQRPPTAPQPSAPGAGDALADRGPAADPPAPPGEATEQRVAPSDAPPADGASAAANASPPERPTPPPPVSDPAIDDAVLEAAVSAIPAGLLAGLALGQAMRSSAKKTGRAGAVQAGRLRGRPTGVQRGDPKGGGRLDLLATLRAAAPWQALRRRSQPAAGSTRASTTSAPVETLSRPPAGQAGDGALPSRPARSASSSVAVPSAITGTSATARPADRGAAAGGRGSDAASGCGDGGRPAGAAAPVDGGAATPSAPRLLIRRDDFRITRFQQRSVTTTLFVVDASGSAALHRLAEAKGAVELLLADCYVRRDNVALLAFRGRAAELLLPPTRSLVRAKRSLAGLPGGGGTPLAAGIEAAGALADAVRRRGETPIVVLLTDGRANIARDGTPGRAAAGADALAAARQFRAAGFAALLLDTSAQPQPSSATLAREMGAVYLPLPYAGAAGLSQAVLAVQSARHVAAPGAAGNRRGA